MKRTWFWMPGSVGGYSDLYSFVFSIYYVSQDMDNYGSELSFNEK